MGNSSLASPGNPSGKKKGKSLAHYLAEVGEAEKTFTLGGQQVTHACQAKLWPRKLYADALKGKPQAAKLILDCAEELLRRPHRSAQRASSSGPEEIEVARTHADWLKLIEDAKGDHADDDASE